MAHKKSSALIRLAMALVVIALMAVAFLRGNYLFGPAGAIIYSLVLAGVIWLCAHSFNRSGMAARIEMIAATIFAVAIGYALAFPATINPDVQHFINKQATDTRVRGELGRVFESDPQFCDLSTSTTHLKVVNVTIHGTLSTVDDLQRLRRRITNECQTLELCPLHWNVRLRATNEHVEGLDRDLFPIADEMAE